jgi:insertion element IS1 protein InsB
VVHADHRVIAGGQRPLVERLWLEKISLHGICRAVGVSSRWLMDAMITRLKALSDHLHMPPVPFPRDVIIGSLDVDADELWNFVKQKANTPGIWLAI